jgi:hypothetical protein
MSKEALGYFDYVKAAFHWKVKLGGLGHLPLNKILLVGFAILGFGNPGFWFIGIAFELAYLLSLSGSERFQKLVQGSLLQKSQVKLAEKQSQILTSLDKPSQERYQRLAQACQGILQMSKNNSNPLGLERISLGDLNQLLWIFLRLLSSRQRINLIISQTARKDLETEIQSLTDKLARENETSAVYRSLKGTLEIQNRRLENRIKAEESLKVAESELDRIEKQVILITEETTVSSDPEVMSVRLDGVMQSLQGTTQWMSEHGEFFGSLEDNLTPANMLPETGNNLKKE